MNEIIETKGNPFATRKETMPEPASEQSFLPNLNICYALSDSFKTGIAQPGDFVLGGTVNLGVSTNVLVVDFRIRACIIKDNTEFLSNYFVSQNMLPTGGLLKHEGYQNYIKQPLGKGCKLVVGTELFLYLVEEKTFALFFCKNTLASYAKILWSKGDGGRMLNLKTVEVSKKGKTWYNLVITPTNRGAVTSDNPDATTKDIEVVPEILQSDWAKFKTVENIEVAPARERLGA